MATINPFFRSGPGRGISEVIWEGMATGDVGAPALPGVAGDISFTATGTIGTSTLTVEGTDEENPVGTPATFQTLRSPDSVALSFTTLPQKKQLLEATKYLRPQVAGGAGASGIRVTVLLRRSTPHV